MSDKRKWTCRFCNGQGVDPWLATHDCPAARRWPDPIVSNDAIFRALHVYDAEAERVFQYKHRALLEPMRAALREYDVATRSKSISEPPPPAKGHILWVRDSEDRVVVEVFAGGGLHIAPEATRQHVWDALCKAVYLLIEEKKKTVLSEQRPSAGERRASE